MNGREPLTTSAFRGQSPIIFGGDARSELVGSLVIAARPAPREGTPGKVRSVRVSGEIQTLASRRLATFAATGQAKVVDGDVALSVNGIHHVRKGASISLLKGESIFEPLQRLTAGSRYTFQLGWPDRADTLQLPLNSASKVDQLLVLPGARVSLVTLRHFSDRSALFDHLPAPLGNAKLELLRWTPIARYPITMERAYQ